MRLQKNILLLMIVCFAFIATTGLQAQGRGLGVIATVNDDIITEFDLEQRISLAILSSRLVNTLENRQQLTPLVLRSLIDERLKVQEALKNNISVSDQELQIELQNIAAKSNLTARQFVEYLGQNGIYAQTLLENYRAEIAWSRVVSAKIRSRIDISRTEIDNAYLSSQGNVGKSQYHLYEIFLGAENPSQLEEARQSADLLSRQARTGANFMLLAKDFSQSATARNNGEVGWVFADEIDEQLRKVLITLKPGQASFPIRTGYGYYILYVANQRTAKSIDPKDIGLSIVRLLLPVTSALSPAQRQTLIDRARSITAQANNCDQFARLAQETSPQVNPVIPPLLLSSMPVEIQNLLKNLDAGQKTDATIIDGSVVVLMVCQKIPGVEFQKLQIAEQLRSERLELAARSYLRDLRRFAVIKLKR
ncbi:MAG: peptidylprolyl isomerase [Alphaproteobacteria bacterium]|nr:peptidylprolyl isomerase [Alphaproteobacteria bacterium]